MPPTQPDGSQDMPPGAASSSRVARAEATRAPDATDAGGDSYDSLTGLPSRALIEERLTQAFVHYEKLAHIAVVAVIGLDGFKAVNDQHGTDAGDQVLRELAHRMSLLLGTDDTLGRLQGDTFALLMCHLEDESPCEAVFRRLLAAITQPVVLASGETVSVTATLSAGIYPDHSAYASGVIARAEEALADAKTYHRGGFLFAPPPLDRLKGR